MRWVAALVVTLLVPACMPADERPNPPPPTPTRVTDAAEITTRPLVLAMNARRPPIDVPEAVAEWIQQGVITNWRDLGQPAAPLRGIRPAAPLRVVDRTDSLRHLPMDTIALVVADAMQPSARAITVAGVDPLRDPDDYPLQVVGPAHPPVTTMTVVGDVMLGRRVTGRPVLVPTARRLASADLTVGNLESTLSDHGAATQDDAFHAPRSARAALRQAGFDALSLANNHVGDYGDRALVETVRLLHAAGLRPFGAGRDLAQARSPVVISRHGIRFGFLAFNAIGETPAAAPGRPGALSVSMPPRTGPLDHAELERVLADVRRLSRRVDVVTVMPHWGRQYTNRPEPAQRVVARALARAGADLVVGGHPHWVQGASMVGDALVVNSLGNFVFDMDTMRETQEGLMLEATFWGDRLVAAEFVPYRIDAAFAPRVLPVASAAHTFDLFWEFSGLAATR